MSQPSDFEIASHSPMQPIEKIAQQIGLGKDTIEHYGAYKAKVDPQKAFSLPNRQGKLILVTAINPTPLGEGKTTVTIGLGDSFRRIGKEAIIAIREPSLGPVFGIKGGAAGGGYAQVIPMEDINLHFTGDLHAIGAANNLLAAMIDNHIHHENTLHLHPKRIRWRRVIDMNDRQLRHIVSGGGNPGDGTLRPDGFDITVASEVMAIFCLAQSLDDLKYRLGQIIIGYNVDNEPVYAHELKANGAMAALLKDAFKPNLVQTIAGTPAFIHGGPFANIAHGCNSILATKLAMHLSDYTITEAGFGADLGAEKFCNIKCRIAGIQPDCVVIVATIRALKYNGGLAKTELSGENLKALSNGLPNLLKHIDNMRKFGLPVVVALNRFTYDSDAEIKMVEQACLTHQAAFALTEVWAKGGEGGQTLAQAVLGKIQEKSHPLHLTYTNEQSIQEKIEAIATKIYGADKVLFTETAKKALISLQEQGFDHLPVCMAKTPLSLSDDPQKLGCPKDFTITVRDVSVSAGAGFVVVLTGNIMKMPGLPKQPAAEHIDIDNNGQITGLF